ncbi:DUF1553 domain-containing protein [Anatilimnocola floriformis]|uniref:DUF1553 domain-containing protein n=1 Tax=Anatilimnocola floriformis TaxID=2948575 RepID=UPI0020C44D15|nr:DUF1553 domain-containing protein [Anatilimnocola floriformis]
MRAWLLLTLVFSLGVSRAHAAEPAIDFDRQIATLLASRCLDCHSGAEPKGKLDLSTAAGALRGGESGPAIVPGKLTDSQLWERIAAGDMPPKKPLPEKEKELLKAWLTAGGKWGSDPIDPYRFSTTARAGQDWWSLQPLRVARELSRESAIDAMLQQKLKEQQLDFSSAADRRTLIRRLSFDLAGLPPTPEEIESFTKDDSPQAYEKLVQRLLDSPHYGERWARHWLDVAHFGESDGFEFDKMRPNAWRYRDWVIDSLNRDMPYDEFAKLQIAGDVLRPSDPQAVIATGFLVGGAFDSLLPAGDAMRQIMRQDELEDIVGLVGQSFLGLTVHCARCHDHKFDPIRAADYYNLAASLAGVRRGERSLPANPPPSELLERQQKLVKQLKGLEEPARTTILAKRKQAIESNNAKLPEPFAAWEFDEDVKDSQGQLHGQLQGKARVENGALVLDGASYVTTSPLPRRIKEKTFEVWVKLANLQQRGGGVMTLQTLDGSIFDSLVYAERNAGHWLAGSNFFQRTKDLQGTAETEADKQFVHIALVYHGDGRIAAYRNGQPYGSEYPSGAAVSFDADKSQIVFGLRHGPAGEGKLLKGLIDRARLYARALTPDEIAASAGVASSYVAEAELVAQLSADQQKQRETIKGELAALTNQVDSVREPKTFAVTPQQPDVSYLLIRGNPTQKGPEAKPAGIRSLTPNHFDFELAANAPEPDRRRKLAEWIASEKNPLFARTLVNRVWQYHFGQGLVLTPNDLGYSGGQPSHPELLDCLAAKFIENKWSLKELHRLIVTSRAYQQSSLPREAAMKVDSQNRLLWRFSPRRLEAESVRDAMLMAAGELNPARGGVSFKDFEPFNRGGTQFYRPIDVSGPEFNRRSIYRMWARGGKNPLLDTFDCPDPSTTTPTRGSTTTPLQALSLLNHSFTLRMADSFAERLKREEKENEAEQIRLAFVLTTGSTPADEQLAASRAFVQKHGLSPFCRVLLNSNAFLYVD